MDKWCLSACWVLSMVIAAATGAQVQAQFVAPPPPVVSAMGSDGFTSKDRETLVLMNNRLRAIHQKIFHFDPELRDFDGH